MNYDLLREVIEKLADYEANNPHLPSNLESFVQWLNQENLKNNSVTQLPQNMPIAIPTEHIEGEISRLVAMLYRYAKVYMKKAIDNSPLQTIDEFGYLAGLMRENGMSKMTLIERNVHEKTTGMEIIKRLLKEGLISQESSIEDKRSKLLFITQKGQTAFLGVLQQMFQAGSIINGNLTADEKIVLWQLLYKLEQFHQPIFLYEKEKSLYDIFLYWKNTKK